jgi:rRNA maturation endonuclease Nob1
MKSMAKVCVACGAGLAEPTKPMSETEDCPSCGGQGTVKAKEEGASSEPTEGENA